MKKKKVILSIVIPLLILLLGASYAFFDYYMLGDNQKIIAGEVYLDFVDKTDSISLTNIYPETIEEARARTDNVITFTLKGNSTIENKDVYYEVVVNEGEEISGKTRFKPEHIVFDLIEVDENGNETLVVDAKRFNDLNERRIWVNTLNRESSINRTYKLRFWLHEGIIISDTESYADYTTSEFENSYLSIKVGVNGDLEEKDVPLTIETSDTYVENNKAYFIAKISNKDNTTPLTRSTNVDNMVLEVSGTNENVVFSYKDSEGNVVTDTSKTLSLSYNFLTEKTVEIQIFLSTLNDANAKTDVNLRLMKNGEEIQHFVQKVDVFGNNFCLNNGFNKLYDCILASDSLATNIGTAKSNIEAKGEPNLNDTAPSYTYVEDITYDVENVFSAVGFKFYFGDSYEFNSITGTFSLYNSDGSSIITDYLSDTYRNYYTCGSINQGSINTCETIYRIDATSVSGTTYTITQGDRITYKVATSIRSEVGLYKAQDDYGDSYVFRGDVLNNNVLFGGYYWKIIRTNGDNSMRLIYNGTMSNSIGNATSINNTTYAYSVRRADPTYVGYMYGKSFKLQTSDVTTYQDFVPLTKYYFADDYEFDETNEIFKLKKKELDPISKTFSEMNATDETTDKKLYELYPYTCRATSSTESCEFIIQVKSVTNETTAKVQYISYSSVDKESTRTNELSSNAKTKIEDWYETNIVGKTDDNGDLIANYIVDGVFCNDRSTSQSGYLLAQNTFYGAYTRLIASTPTSILTCSSDIRDKFSSTTSRGNGLLTYPVALITADEVVLAGGHSNSKNENYYLRTNGIYLTMSPSHFFSLSGNASVWRVFSNGTLNTGYFVADSDGMRPVINLRSDVLISSGDGTIDNPFTLKLA